MNQPKALVATLMLGGMLATRAFEVIRDYNGSNHLIVTADLAELDASDGDRFYYDAATGLLHLKAVTRDNREYANLLIRP